jgi:MoxR-like ATPase
MDEIEISLRNNNHKAVLLIWGAPGIGKTQIVNYVLEAKQGRLIDYPLSQKSPEDFFLPKPDTSEEGKRRGGDFKKDSPDIMLPVYLPSSDPTENGKRDAVANGEDGKGGIFFLDELARAKPIVLNAALKLINERKIGQYVLGSKWTIICASNRLMDDPESGQNFGTALSNRFVHVNFIPDYKSWSKWGKESGRIDQRILDFLDFNKNFFYTISDDIEHDIVGASPRSWEFATERIQTAADIAKEKGKELTMDQVEAQIANAVGSDIAVEFITFMKLLSQYSHEDIENIFKNPAKAPLPPKAKKGENFELAASNAIVLVSCRSKVGNPLTPKEWENFCEYMVKLNNASLATKGIKLMFEIHPEMHMELGEVAGKDKYKNGIDIYHAKYGEIEDNE